MSKPEVDSAVRGRIVWAIFAKEIRETLRDRRALFLLVAMPMIFYPLLMVVIAEVAASQTSKIEATVGQIAVESGGVAPPTSLTERLEGEGDLELVPLKNTEQALSDGEIQALVLLGSNFADDIAQGRSAPVEVRYNSVEPLSVSVVDRVRERLRGWKVDEVTRRLKAKGLDQAYIEPLDYKLEDVAPKARQLGSMASRVLPMLVLIFMVTGAFYPAIDLTAGEKERKTIQTLLTSPVRPLEVVCGKYLTVFTVAMISGVINLLSIVLIVGHNMLLASGQGESGGGLNLGLEEISVVDVVALFAVVTVLGMMFSALLMTIATLASTPKEAQSYLTPVYLLCLLPVLIAQLPGIEMTQATAFLPVLNLALIIKEILIEGVVWEHLFLVAVSSLIVTVLTLALAARLYTREELIIGRAGARGLLALAANARRGLQGRVPEPGEAMALVAVLFVGLYYIGSALQAQDLMVGLLLTFVGILLVPTVGVTLWRGYDLRKVMHLERPPAMAVVGAALLGMTSFVWVSAGTNLFHEIFMPMPEEFIEMMEKTFSVPEEPSGKLGVILVVALAPAVCEEAVFRGWLLSSFRGRTGGVVAVVVTALFFGVFHMSIYRLLGTTTLGLLIGYMVWHTRSIWPAVLFHFLNNTFSLLSADILPFIGVDASAERVPVWLVLASLTIGAMGLIMVHLSVRAPSADGVDGDSVVVT